MNGQAGGQGAYRVYYSNMMCGGGGGGGSHMVLDDQYKEPFKEKSMFSEIATDIKSFIREHRGVIYFVLITLVIDHFFFRGAFKARLHSMIDKMVTKVEEKIQ